MRSTPSPALDRDALGSCGVVMRGCSSIDGADRQRVRIGVAEGVLEHPGALEQVVRQHLPGEAHAAVHLDRGARVLERGLAGEQLRGGAGADRVADLRVVEHGGRRVGGAAGEGGPDVHVGEQVLDGLERADRDAELLALERVAARRLERGIGHAEQHAPRSGPCPTRRSAGGVARVAHARAARERVGAPDRRERIERRDRLERGQVRLRADEHAVGAQHQQRVDLARRARRESDRPARRICSTPPTSRSPLAAPSTSRRRERRPQDGTADEVRAELLEDDRRLDHAEAEAASRSRQDQRRRRRARPARARRRGRSAVRRAARSAPARTGPRRTGGRCPGARAVPRRGGSPCASAASSLAGKYLDVIC